MPPSRRHTSAATAGMRQPRPSPLGRRGRRPETHDGVQFAGHPPESPEAPFGVSARAWKADRWTLWTVAMPRTERLGVDTCSGVER